MDDYTANSAIYDHKNLARNSILATIQSHLAVKQAIMQAEAAGVSIMTIIMTLLPFVLQVLTGGTLDWNAIAQAILALFLTPTPPPAPVTK